MHGPIALFVSCHLFSNVLKFPQNSCNLIYGLNFHGYSAIFDHLQKRGKFKAYFGPKIDQPTFIVGADTRVMSQLHVAKTLSSVIITCSVYPGTCLRR